MNHLEQIEPKKPAEKHRYFCEKCGFKTRHTNDYNKHLLTAKHQNMGFSNQFEPKNSKKPEKTQLPCSRCNKLFHSKSGLWNHNKKCSQKECDLQVVIKDEGSRITIKDLEKEDMVLKLFKENNELKELCFEQTRQLVEQNKQIIEQNKQMTKIIDNVKVPSIVNNGTMNNHNDTFNLNFFLNEKCKDAITLKDFVEGLQISIEDLENVGNNGFVKGISDIFLRGLSTLDVTKRPIHCTDMKRETIYLKDDDKWDKDDKENSKLKNAIQIVENKNLRKMPEWYTQHPGVKVLDSTDYNMQNKIIRNSCYDEYDDKSEKLRDKIIKVLCKETKIEAGKP